ncbi:MAG: hypothetical protein JWQ16_1314 [Novosphingobium sp.]|nr:hypothetical protein [Novosphingobium sp.]
MRARSPWLVPAFALFPALLLSACGGGSTGQPVRSTKPVRAAKPIQQRVSVASRVRRPAPPVTPPPAKVLSLPGLEGVIGATTTQLTREFGTPRLDVWEGDARKLQFTGTPCVLDVYLYPSAQGREPQATYVEARRTTDGRDVDRAACIAGLRK